ncbi:MAG: N-acetyltransferase family protein [Bacillota bacterium]
MRSPVRIREATYADLDVVLSHAAAYYAFDRIPFDPVSVRAGLQALLANPGFGRVWLIESGAGVTGYAVLTFGFDHELGGRTGTLTDFYLREDFRRQGIGTAALGLIEEQARRQGLYAMELQATHENAVAQKLYRKMGYTAFDRVPMAKRL